MTIDLDLRLKSNSKLVEHTLELYFNDASSGEKSHLFEAMSYSVLNGGKRLRATLVLESARLYDVADEITLPIAAAIECMHAYSLVHDDLPAMDDDVLRRGKPTTHVAYDEATAILVGDALQAAAFELIAANEKLSFEQRVMILKELAIAAGVKGMCEGQMLDMQDYQNTDDPLSGIQKIQDLKTGALFKFCLRAGGICGNATKSDISRLDIYANELGFAFQIQDDILDVTSDSSALGKTVQKDIAQNKETAISVLGIENAKQTAFKCIEKAIESIEPLPQHGKYLAAIAQYVLSRSH